MAVYLEWVVLCLVGCAAGPMLSPGIGLQLHSRGYATVLNTDLNYLTVKTVLNTARGQGLAQPEAAGIHYTTHAAQHASLRVCCCRVWWGGCTVAQVPAAATLASGGVLAQSLASLREAGGSRLSNTR